jgi:hypothetical protein
MRLPHAVVMYESHRWYLESPPPHALLTSMLRSDSEAHDQPRVKYSLSNIHSIVIELIPAIPPSFRPNSCESGNQVSESHSGPMHAGWPRWMLPMLQCRNYWFLLATLTMIVRLLWNCSEIYVVDYYLAIHCSSNLCVLNRILIDTYTICNFCHGPTRWVPSQTIFWWIV